MSDAKTKQTDQDVDRFIAGVADEQQRADSETLVGMFSSITGEPPRMWGSSIVGFGSYHYVYDSGREGVWPIIGFSPRARNLSLYIMPGFSNYQALMKRLGKYKSGKSCLYVNRLSDVELDVLQQLAEQSVADMKKKCAAN